MTLPLPSYVKTGLVAGKSIVVDVDTVSDSDFEPDATYPIGSTLLFTPSVDYLVFSVDHATTYLQPITATINSSGDPVTPSGDPLRLVANIGQTDNDQSWFWTVRPKINGKTQTSFRLDVTAGTTSYLSDAQPIPATTPASAVVRGPVGAAGAGAPPAGTPDGAVATSTSNSADWKTPAAAGLAQTPDTAASVLGQVVGYDATAGTKKLRWFTSQEHVARALGWAIVTDSRWAGGADPTGAADSSPAFAAAAAAVASQGGTVYVPSGVFKLNSQITIPTGVRVVGAGIATGGSAVGTQINVNITGGGAAFIGTSGSAAIEQLSVISFSASFTGVLVDFTGSSLTELVQCYLQATSSADLLHLKNAIHHRASKVNFVGGKVQVLGKVLNTDFSNAHVFEGCRWGGASVAAIKNAGQAWQIVGGASEPGAGGIANFYRHDAGVRGENFSIRGMWFGDIAATGPNTTIVWSGDNFSVRDTFCGWNDGTFLQIDENGCNGIVLDNNQYNAFNVHNPTFIVDFGATTGHSGFQFTNKKLATPVTAEIAGTMPADTCLTLKPTPIEFGWTVDPRTASLNNGALTANRTVYLRYRGANGPITKIALAVGVSSGNIAVAAYRNTGSGRSARPGARLGTSGSVACPAAGYQEVALTAAADIRDGDWLSLGADNSTATFALAGGNGTGYALARGLSHFEGAYPPPATATPSGTDAIYSFVLVAVP